MSVIAGYFVLVRINIPRSDLHDRSIHNMFLNIKDTTKADVKAKDEFDPFYNRYFFSFYFPRTSSKKMDLIQKAKSLGKSIKRSYGVIFGDKLKVVIGKDYFREYGEEVEINRPKRRRARR